MSRRNDRPGKQQLGPHDDDFVPIGHVPLHRGIDQQTYQPVEYQPLVVRGAVRDAARDAAERASAVAAREQAELRNAEERDLLAAETRARNLEDDARFFREQAERDREVLEAERLIPQHMRRGPGPGRETRRPLNSRRGDPQNSETMEEFEARLETERSRRLREVQVNPDLHQGVGVRDDDTDQIQRANEARRERLQNQAELSKRRQQQENALRAELHEDELDRRAEEEARRAETESRRIEEEAARERQDNAAHIANLTRQLAELSQATEAAAAASKFATEDRVDDNAARLAAVEQIAEDNARTARLAVARVEELKDLVAEEDRRESGNFPNLPIEPSQSTEFGDLGEIGFDYGPSGRRESILERRPGDRRRSDEDSVGTTIRDFIVGEGSRGATFADDDYDELAVDGEVSFGRLADTPSGSMATTIKDGDPTGSEGSITDRSTGDMGEGSGGEGPSGATVAGDDDDDEGAVDSFRDRPNARDLQNRQTILTLAEMSLRNQNPQVDSGGWFEIDRVGNNFMVAADRNSGIFVRTNDPIPEVVAEPNGQTMGHLKEIAQTADGYVEVVLLQDDMSPNDTDSFLRLYLEPNEDDPNNWGWSYDPYGMKVSMITSVVARTRTVTLRFELNTPTVGYGWTADMFHNESVI